VISEIALTASLNIENNMQVVIEKTDAPMGRLIVRTRERVLFERDGIQPFPSPYEVNIPEGLDPADIEIAFVGLTNGNQPAGDGQIIKPFESRPEPEPEPAAEPWEGEPWAGKSRMEVTQEVVTEFRDLTDKTKKRK
jgi:hypothetical protein